MGLDVMRSRFRCVLMAALDRHQAWANGQAGETSAMRMFFYFNGGLNNRDQAMRTAKNTYLAAEHDEIHPVYMIWPTGGTDSYREDVTHVRNGRWSDWEDPATAVTAPLRPGSDLIIGTASTPAAWFTSINELNKRSLGMGNPAFSMAEDMALLATGAEKVGYGRNLFFDDSPTDDGAVAADQVNRDQRTGATARRLAGRAYFAATAPVRAVTTPLALGFSQSAWRNMVCRTRTSVHAVTKFPSGGPAQAPAVTTSCLHMPAGAGDPGQPASVVLRDC